MRPLGYTNASIFMLCFSLNSRVSFENVKDKWSRELKKYAPGVPIILVGTQSDTTRAISEKEGKRMAKEIGALKYAECSAKTRNGVKECFGETVLIGLDPVKAMKKSKKRCSIQ